VYLWLISAQPWAAVMTDRLGRLHLVTLEAARIDADLPVLAALRSCLNSWRGIGNVERGSYDLQLTRYDARGWRGTFYIVWIVWQAGTVCSARGLGSV
jgi:hypothetical protein